MGIEAEENKVSDSIITTTHETELSSVVGLEENNSQEPVPKEIAPETVSNKAPRVTVPRTTTVSTMKENNVITQQQTTDSIKKEDISFEVNVENENIIVTVPETE